jgi:hypothetical protein
VLCGLCADYATGADELRELAADLPAADDLDRLEK